MAKESSSSLLQTWRTNSHRDPSPENPYRTKLEQQSGGEAGGAPPTEQRAGAKTAGAGQHRLPPQETRRGAQQKKTPSRSNGRRDGSVDPAPPAGPTRGARDADGIRARPPPNHQ